MFTKTRFAVSSAFRDGAARVAVLTRRHEEATKIRSYLCRNGLFPRESSAASDFEATHSDIELLSADADPHTLAAHIIDRLDTLVPGLDTSVVTQIKKRLGAGGVRLAGASDRVRPFLTALAPLYQTGPAGFFTAMAASLDACRAAGHHVPQQPALRPLLDTASMATAGVALPDLVDEYADRAARAATHTTSREPSGLYVMTVHQSKGKEFEAIVLLPASRRHFGDSSEDRRLFYVALTRARSHWTLISPDNDPSPLLAALDNATPPPTG